LEADAEGIRFFGLLELVTPWCEVGIWGNWGSGCTGVFGGRGAVDDGCQGINW